MLTTVEIINLKLAIATPLPYHYPKKEARLLFQDGFLTTILGVTKINNSLRSQADDL